MFTLFVDRAHLVLLAKIEGVFSSQDMADLDQAVIQFLSRGLAPSGAPPSEAQRERVRAVYDFSAVAAIAVPATRLDERGQRPPIVRQQRVIVAPPSASEGFAAAFRANQRHAANSEPAVVRDLREAYRLLDLEDPRFEPVGAC